MRTAILYICNEINMYGVACDECVFHYTICQCGRWQNGHENAWIESPLFTHSAKTAMSTVNIQNKLNCGIPHTHTHARNQPIFAFIWQPYCEIILPFGANRLLSSLSIFKSLSYHSNTIHPLTNHPEYLIHGTQVHKHWFVQAVQIVAYQPRNDTIYNRRYV